MKGLIEGQLRHTADVLAQMAADEILHTVIENVTTACVDSLRAGGKILLAGNGGSAADAQHIAAEFVSRYAFDRPALRAIALTTDTSVLTAIGNDYAYDQVFARQVQALGDPGDVLVGISTSGQSANVLNAFRQGRDQGVVCIGLTGSDGGDMATLCDHLVRVPATETPRIQEGHIAVAHIVCGLVEKTMFADQS